jgi:hypothetical protein
MNNLIKEQLTNLDYNAVTDLCSIMSRCGSDKCGTHNYTIVYDFLFKSMRYKSINILECGMGSINPNILSNMGPGGTPGASLFGWAEYFSDANIYGCDIDADIDLKQDGIKTFVCDQTKPESIKSMWDQIPVKFDIIIDDGWHVFEANKCFFENSFHKLKSGGIYVMEDVFSGNGRLYKRYLNSYGVKNNYVVQLPCKTSLDNCLAIIFKD